jgi:hypothetical protein
MRDRRRRHFLEKTTGAVISGGADVNQVPPFVNAEAGTAKPDQRLRRSYARSWSLAAFAAYGLKPGHALLWPSAMARDQVRSAILAPVDRMNGLHWWNVGLEEEGTGWSASSLAIEKALR